MTTKVNPYIFKPNSEAEYAALKAWNELEPENPDSFNFYLWAIRRGLPTSKFFGFSAEIQADKSVRNKGALFNAKVQEYFKSIKRRKRDEK